ncbi:MAG: sensor histidine kinase, partial [Sarcina sp.]
NIAKATEEISKGNLDVNLSEEGDIVTSRLAKNINNISNGLKLAVDNKIKSERMKGELITNVSHDLKTPLTSIINYIHLLKDERSSEEEKVEYIKILDRKSQRLKALIEDLFEVSKAASGSMELNLEKVEIIAILRQTIGELKERIDESNITIRTNFPENKVYCKLDGNKTWRVFENLIVNISKYSLQGSRAFVEVVEKVDKVEITMKNISSEELNFNANEIVERFKRGDQSRHTEGSGLGLAISKSIVELQGGNFDIVIDGDLFKVVIVFDKINNI